MDLLNNKRNLSGDKKKKKKVSRRYRKKVVSVDIKAVTERQREAKQRQREIKAKIKAFFTKTKSFIKKYKIAFASATATIIIALVLLIALKPFQEKTEEELVATTTPAPSATESPVTQQTIVIEDQPEDDHGFPSYMSEDLKNAILTNKDTIGFISIDETRVFYPVVQSDDNDYYLKHTFEDAIFKTGTIYMDCNNDVDSIDDSGNFVIYGHKMMNGKMFSDLFNYKKKSYFDEHKIVEFETLKGPMEWEIFSVFAVDASFNYIKTNFRTDESFAVFLDTCKRKSIYETGVTPEPDDSIITLSTCSYEQRNYRLVVQARLIKDTEENQEDTTDEKGSKDTKS